MPRVHQCMAHHIAHQMYHQPHYYFMTQLERPSTPAYAPSNDPFTDHFEPPEWTITSFILSQASDAGAGKSSLNTPMYRRLCRQAWPGGQVKNSRRPEKERHDVNVNCQGTWVSGG